MRAFRPKVLLQSIALLMALLVNGQVFAERLQSTVLSRDEFYLAHPAQRAVDEAFARRVTQPAVAMTYAMERPVRILVVYPGLQVSDYWRRSIASFERRLTELGVDYRIDAQWTRPADGIQAQAAAIGEAMADPPDFLVFTLDAERHRGMIQRIAAGDDTKIILQNITTPLRVSDAFQPFLYVGFDHATGARLLARRYLELFPNGAQYAIFHGTRGLVSEQRGQPFLQAMNAAGNMTLVGSYYVDFDRVRANDAALNLLDLTPDVDFIYASSTDIAHGIVDALRERGQLDRVMVNGWGGGASELAAVVNGELAFTAMRMNDDNGVAMAEAIALSLSGTPAEQLPQIYSGEFRLVDSAMTAKELSALSAYAFRYSN